MDEKLKKSTASRCVEICGGIDATAAFIGRHRTVVNRWLLPKEKGGTGGVIPARHWPKFVEVEGITYEMLAGTSSEGEAA